MDHAFTILVAEHRPMLLAHARALCYGDGHAAEDVVQETLLVACRRLDEFRAETHGHFGRWLRGIARTKALEAHRAAGRGRVVAASRIIEGLEDVFGRLDPPSAGDEAWEETVRRRCRRVSRHRARSDPVGAGRTVRGVRGRGARGRAAHDRDADRPGDRAGRGGVRWRSCPT